MAMTKMVVVIYADKSIPKLIKQLKKNAYRFPHGTGEKYIMITVTLCHHDKVIGDTEYNITPTVASPMNVTSRLNDAREKAEVAALNKPVRKAEAKA